MNDHRDFTNPARPLGASRPEVDAAQAEVRISNLPVHFFTIVLNGQPFLRHHIEQFGKLPFSWHWHVVEGVADLKHDTAWSKAAGGAVPANLHWNGLSIDGTTEYLDALKAQFPDNITIYRPPAGKFWDGKREMVNAPLSRITEDCLLWQVDADELWTAAQMIRTRALFLVNPDKTAALFYCHYFVGPELVITSRDTYGNNSSYEWLRVWRYRPGDRWAAHEPPRLQRGDKNVGAINPFRHAETEAMGLVFQHFGYAVEAQVRFKESYYGYAGAVEQWRRLQETKNFPQRLSNHFAWVTDAAMVNRAGRLGITRLAPPEWFGAAQPENHAGFGGAQRILFVRTDSIGDAVLASAMLEPIRKKHPHAKLAVLCQHQVAELYTACPYVDSVICYDRKKMSDLAERAQILAEITNFKPDEILNSVRSRDRLSNELTQGFRGARHIAIEGDLDHIWTSDHVRSLSGYEQIISSPGKFKPELARHEDFLRGLGIQAGHLQPVVWTRPADEILADAFFKREKLDPAKTIAVFPGASLNIRVYYGYAEALETLDDFRFLVFGDTAQSGLAVELEQQLPGRTVNLCGRSTLRETIALLRRCRLYVGAESAGAHIACAVGVPNVVLLGGGHFGRFMPYSPLTSVVSLPLACFGCNWRCTHKYAHCVKDVSAQVLAEAIRQTLAKPAARPRLFLQSTELWKASAGLPQWQMPHLFVPADQVETILVAPGHSDFPSPPENPDESAGLPVKSRGRVGAGTSGGRAPVARCSIALFNDTGKALHVGCRGVTLAHGQMLSRLGVEIKYRFYLGDWSGLWKGNRAASMRTFHESILPELFQDVDAVVVNGEGTIHHGAGLHLLTLLAGAQELGLPTMLVNAVFQECLEFGETLRRLDDFTVRDARSSAYLKRLGIPHRVVLDSIIDAEFDLQPVNDFSGKIVVTDWHPLRHKDVGAALKQMLAEFGERAVYFPLDSPARADDWKHAVADLSSARLVVTGRHHGVCLAGLAGVPFVALGSNTWKVEGMLELLPGNLHICNDPAKLRHLCEQAMANPGLYREIRNFLHAQRPLSTFQILASGNLARRSPVLSVVGAATPDGHREILDFVNGVPDESRSRPNVCSGSFAAL